MSGRSIVMRLAVGVAGLLLVGACTGSPAPGPSQTATGSSVSTSTSTVTTSTPTATSTMGVTATEEAAAIAAAQAYVGALNQAFSTRSTTKLRTLFVPGCVVCERDADMIDGWRTSGRSIAGGALAFGDVTVVRWDNATHLLLKGQMTTAPSEIKDASGRVVDRFPGGTGVVYLPMSRLGAAWLVEGVSS